MRKQPFRSLLVGPSPSPERVFFTEVWFRGHNNPRYSELLPRMERVDPYLIPVTGVKYARGVQFRTLRATEQQRYKVVFPAVRKRYRSMFSVDPGQIPYFNGPTLVDIDDPYFTPDVVTNLNRPQVKAVVCTCTRMADRYRELGLDKPVHIVPQGVDRTTLDPAGVAEVAKRERRDGEVVMGAMGSWLLSKDDRGGHDPGTNVDHLLDLWDQLHERVPNARLWLVGQPGEAIKARCAGRDDILLAGYKQRDEILSWVGNFDVALFARGRDFGWQLAKFADYLGCGVPTVAYDYKVTTDLKTAGAGVFARTPEEWLDAAEQVATDPALRARVAAAAEAEGKRRDWDVLARDYSELFDTYLPA